MPDWLLWIIALTLFTGAVSLLLWIAMRFPHQPYYKISRQRTMWQMIFVVIAMFWTWFAVEVSGRYFVLAGFFLAIAVLGEITGFVKGPPHPIEGLCEHCSYNLQGTIAAGRVVCPECGAAISDQATQATRATQA